MMLFSSDNLFINKSSKYNQKYVLKYNQIANCTLFGRKVLYFSSFIMQCTLFTEKKKGGNSSCKRIF